ncbi:hypothetical protein I310_03416 [Cryptococcus deuterogattii CA1014]|nr:hypothetical protein I310_03416 [Cryptococcus deuterogattii CA1014]
MPPSTRPHKSSSPRRKSAHPYHRPSLSVPAAQPSVLDTKQESLNTQDKQHVSDASGHLSVPEASLPQGSEKRKKKNKRKKNKKSRAMQLDAIKSSYAPPSGPFSPSKSLQTKCGTDITSPISHSVITEAALLPLKHNTPLISLEPSSDNGPAMQQHDSTKKDLTEALTCTVCFEILRDPYMLSCGHMACKSCLFDWFRSPGAYRRPPTPITPTSNLSYYTKICHMCRCIIVRRPTRVFFLRSILEPLGLHQDDPPPPLASHPAESSLSAASDPWKLIFPPDPITYKLHDDDDHCLRCPECMGEVEDGSCFSCGINFSSDSEMEGQSEEDFDGLDEDSWPSDEDDESRGAFFQHLFRFHPHLTNIYNQRHPLGVDVDDDESDSDSNSMSMVEEPPNHVSVDNMSVDEDVITDSEGYEDSFIDDEEEESCSEEDSGDSDVVLLDNEDRPLRGGPPPRVRSIMSESGNESDQPVFTGRTRRTAGRVVSDSE